MSGEVVNDSAGGRLRLELPGGTGELDYRVTDGQMVILHTGVPPALEGGGIGGRLVEAAVEWAASQGLTVVPVCPFAAHWLEEHPDVAGLAADAAVHREPPSTS